MQQNQIKFLFLNIGHFLDHLFMLIFASVAALALTSEWGMSYSELILYATPSFIAFGVCAIGAGWIADKWSREGMMVVFFVGIGLSSVLTSFAGNPFQIGVGLLFIGVFAAIYHPVGLALVVQGRNKTGVPLAVNGVFGNMGVACAALFTGFLIDVSGWRSAFVLPGVASILLGVFFLLFVRSERRTRERAHVGSDPGKKTNPGSISKDALIRVFAVIFFTTALGGLIFQSTTFSLPRVFEEQLSGSATQVGWYAFVVFSLAALAQLVVGYLVDRYSIRVIFLVIAFLQSVLFVVMTQVSGSAALIVAVAFMLVVFGQIPINDVLIGRTARSEWRSRAYAIRYVVTFTVMASAVPMIAWIHSAWGFGRLFALLALAASLILVAVLFLPKSEGVMRQQPAEA